MGGGGDKAIVVRELIRRAVETAPSTVHVLAGALSVLLEIEVAATIAFLAYQLVDLKAGESPTEMQLDVVEWMIGLVLGALIKTLAPL